VGHIQREAPTFNPQSGDQRVSVTTMQLLLPHSLQGAKANLEKALAVPVEATWDPNDRFRQADQPAAIGRALVGHLHQELANARISYLFREDMTKVWAKAGRASAKVAFLADIDFTIEFSWVTWLHLTAEQRIALVDHELCHCSRGDEGGWVLIEHDVEEFAGIVHRWGLWRPSLRNFKGALDLAQIELPLDRPEAA